MQPLRIGIIGTGWFSQVHADHLVALDDVVLQAICGSNKEKGDQMARRYGATGYGHVKDMLEAEKLDAVYICVPPMAHGEIEELLIERGIPFLVEKPIGTDTELPRRLLRQIEAKSLLTSVGYHFRYKATVAQMKQLLGEQHVGMAVGQWMGSMPGVAWWRQQEGSGGQFIEQTTHIVDILRYCLGDVEEVYAMYGSRVMHEQHDYVSVPDVGTVTLKLSSGVIANISNTCVLPGSMDQTGITFYTGEGILDWNPSRLKVMTPQVSTEYTDPTNPYMLESEAFIHAIRTGDTSGIRSDYADAFKTQLVTCAALESATLGKPVKIQY
ncbi:Gfo/Idh/MocA family protein [Paenibacillus macquariensis]|uniref:Predicted dehydrogenase n=1 Tax=Paenibacillus macquariensis TaxID=948756 RepID=A0ABY1K9U4_9BACL|nr:Gfo/Idh/MocA family oxidoreductase [Paenibacillus macquariensis]MEC0092405.1 Gfo/Idh/MocA family oxidoreductase [Paenibacillus macquariensis]OAB35374.1 oxidoreductase [Paenibacillus macquariensis subsp. macquariensis]SIR47796.1 Predicted dehydrogenase [Paenibacillus macquariensis]